MHLHQKPGVLQPSAISLLNLFVTLPDHGDTGISGRVAVGEGEAPGASKGDSVLGQDAGFHGITECRRLHVCMDM